MLYVHCGVQCCHLISVTVSLSASLGAGLNPFLLCWKTQCHTNAVWMQDCFPGLCSSSRVEGCCSSVFGGRSNWAPWAWGSHKAPWSLLRSMQIWDSEGSDEFWLFLQISKLLYLRKSRVLTYALPQNGDSEGENKTLCLQLLAGAAPVLSPPPSSQAHGVKLHLSG